MPRPEGTYRSTPLGVSNIDIYSIKCLRRKGAKLEQLKFEFTPPARIIYIYIIREVDALLVIKNFRKKPDGRYRERTIPRT